MQFLQTAILYAWKDKTLDYEIETEDDGTNETP